MKKLLILFVFALFMSNQVFALPVVDEEFLKDAIKIQSGTIDDEESSIIKKVSFRDKFRKSPEAQIDDFIKKHTKYVEKNNIAKLKEMYSDCYVNNDGFDKETVFKMMQISIDTYEDIKNTTKIDNIRINGNYASFEIHEIVEGQTVAGIQGLEGNGSINSEIHIVNYLKKEGNKWKIISTDVKSEFVTLKYGEAKNMRVDISAPDYIAQNTEYDATVSVATPLEAFVIGSIVNEKIVFPVQQSKDVYRSVKSDELARVLRSNNDDKNEYVTVSLAVTRAQLDPSAVVINMTGMAFAMKRVNVIPRQKLSVLEDSINDENQKL